MTDEAWMALAFLGGPVAAIVHFKASGWAGAALLAGLPCALLVVAGWPDGVFHEPFPALLVWAVIAFPGYAAGVALVVLRVVR
jgi:hypothetical protein